MGREATIHCQWAGESGICKVLLESRELIVRGAIRRRAPISDVSDVSVREETLRFRVGPDDVSLALGSELASRWAKAIATPPPSLAAKLGISSTTRLLLLGDLESKELQSAIAEAEAPDGKGPNLILVSVANVDDLNRALDRILKSKSAPPPLWVVYPKGKREDFGESSVRAILRELGFIDTKVASVSSSLTALRFIQPGQ